MLGMLQLHSRQRKLLPQASWLVVSIKIEKDLTDRRLATYGAPYPDGTIAQGGYASHIRAHEYFTFTIPENIPTEEAAPMLCAGITTYSPLVRAKTGPGKKVAILGMQVPQLLPP